MTVGYTVAIAAVFTMSGGLVAMTLSQYTSWHPWWGPFSLVLTAGAIWLTARGVKLSTTAVGAAVLVQVAIMVAVCLLVLVDQRAALSGIPFSWAHLTGGLAGFSAGFPLALFMFIGWENGPALAEEARNPRRTDRQLNPGRRHRMAAPEVISAQPPIPGHVQAIRSPSKRCEPGELDRGPHRNLFPPPPVSSWPPRHPGQPATAPPDSDLRRYSISEILH